jgi:hypothetical protein
VDADRRKIEEGVAGREAGAQFEVQRPVSGGGCDVANPIQHLGRCRQQVAGRCVPNDPAAVPVKEPALQLVFEFRQRLAGGCLGRPMRFAAQVTAPS